MSAEIQASRLPARTDAQGQPVLLMDQDRARWDHLLVRRGLAALDKAEQLARTGKPWGPYALQGAIAACHARARQAQDTDWPHIVALYDALLQVAPSPVVALNRVVAVGMAEGPEAALALVDALAGDPLLRHYHWLPSVRGDLLAKLGRGAEARAEFERAASLTRNAREKALLLARLRPEGRAAPTLIPLQGHHPHAPPWPGLPAGSAAPAAMCATVCWRPRCLCTAATAAGASAKAAQPLRSTR